MSSSLSDESLGSSRLSFPDSAVLDQYAEIQAELLGKGKEVEYFIRENESDEPCFKLLVNLFNLFKSEFATNLALRKRLKSNEMCLDKFSKQKTQIRALQKLFGRKISLGQIGNAAGTLAADGLFRENVVENTISERDALKACLSEKGSELDNVVARLDSLRLGDGSEKERLQRLQGEEAELRAKLSQMQHEGGGLDGEVGEFSGLVDSIKEKIEETVDNARTVVKYEKQEIGRMRERVRRLRRDIRDRKAEKCDIEEQLDVVNKEIDFLTDPVAIAKHHGMDSAHLVRYDVVHLQRRYESMEQEMEDESAAIESLEKKSAAMRAKLAELQQLSETTKGEIASMQEECEMKKGMLQRMIETRRKIRFAKQELAKIDMAKRHAIIKGAKLKNALEESRAACRHLEITGNSLIQSSDSMSSEQDTCAKSLTKSTLSDTEAEHFDAILDAFRHIRSSLNLPPAATPRDIRTFCKTFH